MNKQSKDAIEATQEWADALTCLYRDGLGRALPPKVLYYYEYSNIRYPAVGRAGGIFASVARNGEVAVWIADSDLSLCQKCRMLAS